MAGIDYVVDPTNIASPLDNNVSKKGAAELRALKAYIATLAGISGAGQLNGLQNRVINGDMRIDQRHNFIAYAPDTTTLNSYGPDNIRTYRMTAGATVSCQCVSTGGAIEDLGIGHILNWNNTVAAAPAIGDVNAIWVPFEGLNIADFCQGQGALAQPMTVSFRFYASLAGEYSVALNSGALDRSYVHTFNAVVGYQLVSFTVPGCPDGTFAIDNTAGMYLMFDMGHGTNWETNTIDAWQAGAYRRKPSSIKMINSVAQVNIGAIQLIKGAAYKPFEQRPYGLEFLLCQRYLPGVTGYAFGVGQNVLTTEAYFSIPFKVPARRIPTGLLTSPLANFKMTTAGGVFSVQPTASFFSSSLGSIQFGGCYFDASGGGLVAGGATILGASNLTDYILFTGAEL